jgi:hypothetical protein
VPRAPAVVGIEKNAWCIVDQLPQRGNGAGDPGLVNFAMVVDRDMIASINKAIDNEGLSLNTKALRAL